MKLYLDDRRPAPDGWMLVKDFWEFKNALTDNPEGFEEISFDYDLGADKTGMHCLSILHMRCMSGYPAPKIITIHTGLEWAGEEMEISAREIDGVGKVVVAPCYW